MCKSPCAPNCNVDCVADDGYDVDYLRIPVTDEKAPKDEDFGTLVSVHACNTVLRLMCIYFCSHPCTDDCFDVAPTSPSPQNCLSTVADVNGEVYPGLCVPCQLFGRTSLPVPITTILICA